MYSIQTAGFCLAALTLAFLLQGCAGFDIRSPFNTDPLTGGVNASVSELLNIPLPPGLQRYPDHSRATVGINGKQGLETLRGYVNQNSTALSVFSSMRDRGWNLRMHERMGQRAIYVYQKSGEYATFVFYPQGTLTIAQIWLGPALPDGAALSLPQDSSVSAGMSMSGGENLQDSPAFSSTPKPGNVEKWGSGLEERAL